MTQVINANTENGKVVEVITSDLTAQHLDTIMASLNADVLIF
jgi:hypothetical protein